MTSELRVDNLKGSTTGGSINVLGEGTSATTNLQQGLVKLWVHFSGDASGAASNDSFNVSGMTDTGTGDYEVGINNNMGNAFYACGVAGRVSGNISFDDGGNNSTSSVGIGALADGNSRDDANAIGVLLAGDLA